MGCNGKVRDGREAAEGALCGGACIQMCVECEEKDANRLCKQCNDRYCTACFNKTHAGGKRASHTFVQIGPIDCSECEKEVSDSMT